MEEHSDGIVYKDGDENSKQSEKIDRVTKYSDRLVLYPCRKARWREEGSSERAQKVGGGDCEMENVGRAVRLGKCSTWSGWGWGKIEK